MGVAEPNDLKSFNLRSGPVSEFLKLAPPLACPPATRFAKVMHRTQDWKSYSDSFCTNPARTRVLHPDDFDVTFEHFKMLAKQALPS